MKKILFLPLLLLFVSNACKKQEDNTPKETTKNQFSLKLDGKFLHIPFETEWFNQEETILMIEAGSSNSNSGKYQLYIQTDIPPGSYEHGAGNQPHLSFHFYKDNKTYDSYDGTFRILSNDLIARRIKIQFQIKLYYVHQPSDSYEITEGYIVANY